MSSSKNRTAVTTIEDLLTSKRFELAVEFFKEDKMMMRAILVELAMEAARVQKTALTREFSVSKSLSNDEILYALKNVDAGVTWNIYWGLSESEQMLYSIDPKCQKSKHERIILLDQIQKGLVPKIEEIKE